MAQQQEQKQQQEHPFQASGLFKEMAQQRVKRINDTVERNVPVLEEYLRNVVLGVANDVVLDRDDTQPRTWTIKKAWLVASQDNIADLLNSIKDAGFVVQGNERCAHITITWPF